MNDCKYDWKCNDIATYRIVGVYNNSFAARDISRVQNIDSFSTRYKQLLSWYFVCSIFRVSSRMFRKWPPATKWFSFLCMTRIIIVLRIVS